MPNDNDNNNTRKPQGGQPETKPAKRDDDKGNLREPMRRPEPMEREPQRGGQQPPGTPDDESGGKRPDVDVDKDTGGH